MSNWKSWEVAEAEPQPKNVDLIVAQFDSMIADLADVAHARANEIKNHEQAIVAITQRKADAENEFQRAQSVIGKIQALIQ